MTTPTTVTDPALERMLARRAHRADPIGLADAVFAALETIEPRRGPRLGVPAWWLPSRPSRGLAWMLVVATLLLALLASALVGTSLLQSRPPIALVPTGGEAMAPESGVYDRVVADGAGTLWAIGTGHVTRFDLASGKRQTWTVADDAVIRDALRRQRLDPGRDEAERRPRSEERCAGQRAPEQREQEGRSHEHPHEPA